VGPGLSRLQNAPAGLGLDRVGITRTQFKKRWKGNGRALEGRQRAPDGRQRTLEIRQKMSHLLEKMGHFHANACLTSLRVSLV